MNETDISSHKFAVHTSPPSRMVSSAKFWVNGVLDTVKHLDFAKQVLLWIALIRIGVLPLVTFVVSFYFPARSTR